MPLVTGNCDADSTTPNAPASESDPNLIQCAKAGNEYGAISASLDGRNLQKLDQYRTLTGFFNLTVPKIMFSIIGQAHGDQLMMDSLYFWSLCHLANMISILKQM